MICTLCFVFLFQLLSLTGASESGIVGGRVARPHSRPYMVSLQVRGQHICGGVLVREDFVLTVAHCKGHEALTVVLGAHNISKKEESQQVMEVAKYHPHLKFTGNYEYDIMLLQLKGKAKLNKNVTTMKLPNKNKNIRANVKCDVAGWGYTAANGSASEVLKEATETLQFSFECKKIWQQYIQTDQMICTKFDKKKGGVCQGDSGGPLICKGQLEGLTAATLKSDCNDPKFPHIFTKVRFFLPWIQEVMGGPGNVA